MDRAGITAEEARKRFRGKTTEVDVQVAHQLLAHAEKIGVDTIPEDMPASVKVHATKLFSSNPEIRRQAAEMLGQLGAEAQSAATFVAENILDLSTDKPLPASVIPVDVDAALGTAADTLEQLGLPALSPLIDSLRQGTERPAAKRPKRTASGFVGELLTDRLIGRLKDGSAVVRVRSARLLGASGSQKAVKPLVELLEDENQQVRQAAAEALKSLTDQEFGADAKKWQQWLKNR
jgi:HEAT repeat protein